MGWAARANKSHEARTTLTAERCADIAATIRSGVAALGLRLTPTNDLERMARDAEWLAKEPGALEGRPVADEERRSDALLTAEQAGRVAATLQLLPLLKNHEPAVRWLRGRIDRLQTQDTEALDHLFELEMAGRLARATDLTVSIEEPDIVATLPSGRSFLIACKRPRSLKGVSDSIRTAKHQIRELRAGRAAVIFIGTEAIFHKSDKPGKQTIVYTVSAPQQARALGEKKIAEAISAADKETERAFSEGVSATLYCGSLVFLTKRPPTIRGMMLSRGVWNLADPGSHDLLRNLQRILFGH